MNNCKIREKNESFLYIDALKIIAAFSVVIYHVCMEYRNSYGDPGWTSIVFYSAFTRYCVPIFFMISGAFIIRSSEDILDFIKRKYLKILIPLVFWSLFYYLFLVLNLDNISHVNVEHFLENTIYKPSSIHLWFLYAMLGTYLLIPIWSSISQKKKNACMVYYTLLWFIFSSLLPFIRLFDVDVRGDFGTWFFVNETMQLYNYSGYFSLGYVLFSNKLNFKIRHVSLIFLLSFSFFIFFLAIKDSNEKMSISEDFWGFKSPLVVAVSALMFILVRELEGFFSRFKGKLNSVSNLTFGIYLVHVLFIHFVVDVYGNFFSDIALPIRIPVQTIIVVVFSALVTHYIKKIKFLRKIV